MGWSVDENQRQAGCLGEKSNINSEDIVLKSNTVKKAEMYQLYAL